MRISTSPRRWPALAVTPFCDRTTCQAVRNNGPSTLTIQSCALVAPADPLSAWWLGLSLATLEFWVRFPNERNQGKQSHPVLKYWVPHGSHLHGLSRQPHEHVHSSLRSQPLGDLEPMMIILLLFLQKQSLAYAIYLLGFGTLLSGPGSHGSTRKKTYAITFSPKSWAKVSP